MTMIPRDRVLATLKRGVGGGEAGLARAFAEALRAAGLPDKRAYTPAEVERIGSAVASSATRRFEAGLNALERLEAEQGPDPG
ncbi:MAG: hypothetical protein ACLGIN_05760 [Candidatus Sericytochromatia bacterium]